MDKSIYDAIEVIRPKTFLIYTEAQKLIIQDFSCNQVLAYISLENFNENSDLIQFAAVPLDLKFNGLSTNDQNHLPHFVLVRDNKGVQIIDINKKIAVAIAKIDFTPTDLNQMRWHSSMAVIHDLSFSKLSYLVTEVKSDKISVYCHSIDTY